MDERLFSQSYSEEYPHHHGNDRKKIQTENEYLRERVKSCEKGFATLYQVLHIPEKAVGPAPRVLSYHRSASQLFKQVPPSPKSDSDDFLPRQITIPELKEAIQQMVRERGEFQSQLEDMNQVTEAAKRERILAIDEKDKILHSAHLLKVALERKDGTLQQIMNERDDILTRCRHLESEVMSMRRTTEEAMQTRSLALEERSKVIDERNQLKLDLSQLQLERDKLFEDKVRIKGLLQEMASDKLQSQERMEQLSNRCAKYESIARSLKEQNDVLNERERETQTVKMHRSTLSQPWGFSIEGGHNSEFYHHDPSIVVTGIADNTPATNTLKFGDRILSVEGRDFQSVTRKEAVEVLRSCDQMSIAMEISRTISNVKSQPLEVRIPGKKVFGFSYESRLFVTSVEEGSAASDWLLPGDEIIQVMGKSTVNMKPSHLKQTLKSCKDGIVLTIHRGRKSTVTMTTHSTPSAGMTIQRHTSKTSSEFQRQKPPSEFFQSYQAPGTPGSTMSESSAGYHSSHSLPSCYSNAISPVGQEVKNGQSSLDTESAQTQHSGSQQSDPDQPPVYESISARYRAASAGSNTFGGRSNFRHRHGDVYSSRMAYLSQRTGQTGFGTGQSSIGTGQTGFGTGQSSIGTGQTGFGTGQSSIGRSETYSGYQSHRTLPKYYRHGNQMGATPTQPFSASFDHLEKNYPAQGRRRLGSHDLSHDATPTHPRQALSLSNMYSGVPKHSHV